MPLGQAVVTQHRGGHGPQAVVVSGRGECSGSGLCLPSTDTWASCEGIPTFQSMFFNADSLCIFVNWETSKPLCPGKTRDREWQLFQIRS